MWNFIERLGKKLIAGSAVIAGMAIGQIIAMTVNGVPLTDPTINTIIAVMSWQIWDNVIVPTIDDLKPKQTAAELIKHGSLKLVG